MVLEEQHYHNHYPSQRNNQNNNRYNNNRNSRGYRDGVNRYNSNPNEYYEDVYGTNDQSEQQQTSTSKKSQQSSSNNNGKGTAGEGLTVEIVNGGSDNNGPKPQRTVKQTQQQTNGTD